MIGGALDYNVARLLSAQGWIMLRAYASRGTIEG